MKNGVLSSGILLCTLVFHFKSGDSVMKGVDFFFSCRADNLLTSGHVHSCWLYPSLYQKFSADVLKLCLAQLRQFTAAGGSKHALDKIGLCFVVLACQ